MSGTIGSWPPHCFPHLSKNNYSITSPATGKYNCIAWAAGDTRRKWWPDSAGIGYWPSSALRKETLQAFQDAYSTLEYEPCTDATLEPDVQKIAIYARKDAAGEVPTHAAIQQENGRWSSKIGDCEDIEHELPESLEGGLYGCVVAYMARPRRNHPSDSL